MHTITLKSDDKFFKILNDMVKAMDTTRSDLIRRAVIHYKDSIEKKKLKKQIEYASHKVRGFSKDVIADFDATMLDGLDE